MNHLTSKSLFLVGAVLTAAFAQSAKAADGAVYIGKIETKESGQPAFVKFASGYFVDDQSVKTDRMHVCGSKAFFVTSNDYFKGLPLGQKAKVKVQLRYVNDQNAYIDADATLKARDYFSGAAVLDVDSRTIENEMNNSNYALNCIGLQGGGGAGAKVQGFKYYSLNGLIVPTNGNLEDRGMKGALILDGSNSSVSGMAVGDYFKAGSTNEGALQTQSLKNVGDFVTRVLRNQIQSSKGVVYYMPDQESFVYKGMKDAFVMAPEKEDGTGKVRILGSPDEYFTDPGLKREYVQIASNNAFQGLMGTTGAGSQYFLKSIDGQAVKDWKSAIDLFSTNYVERSAPLIEFEVRSGERFTSFLVGSRFQEWVSLMRWIILTNDAIYETPRRPLNNNEQATMRELQGPVNRMYEIFSTYNSTRVTEMEKGKRDSLFTDFQAQAKSIVTALTDPKNGMSKYDDRAKTLFTIQKWAQELQKWVDIERSKTSRESVITNDREWHNN
ncbi:hypothetical protein K2X30_08530 [bacterium]|nr:hypothetical protein [bacterium]